MSVRCPWRETRFYGLLGGPKAAAQDRRSAARGREERFALANRVPCRAVGRRQSKGETSRLREVRTHRRRTGQDGDETELRPNAISYLPPRAAHRQGAAPYMVPPHRAASRVVSAASPACARKAQCGRKAAASARHAIPHPTPLAPWRGPRGWGSGGAQYEPVSARKTTDPRDRVALPQNRPRPGPPTGPFGPNTGSVPRGHCLCNSRQGQRGDKHVLALWRLAGWVRPAIEKKGLLSSCCPAGACRLHPPRLYVADLVHGGRRASAS